jgi:glycosyltransferase involved in cell wall biosynthesis
LKVAFLTHYYAPERGAPQTRLAETIAGLQHLGMEASVITGPPHYPAGKVLDGRRLLWPRTDRIAGVPVHRLPMIPRPNAGLVDRVNDQGSFAVVASLAAPTIRQHDVFVVESPPLFLGATAALLRALTGRPYLFHVADPWPDFPIEAGVLRGRLPIALALRLEELAYRGADLITTVTPPLVDRLSRKPGAGGKVRLLLNTVDTSRFDPSADPAGARARAGWDERPTLLYTGTVGRAQGRGTLLEAARRLNDPTIGIRVIGDGLEARELRERAARMNLGSLVFQPSVPPGEVPALLAAADGILVLLRQGPLYDESLPTKLVEGLAAGRPLVVSADGYAADLVRESGAGLAVPAEDPGALARAIQSLMERSDRPMMGAAAARLASTFTRAAGVARLADLLEEIVRTSRRSA